jgi:hypothetical protein
VRRDRHFEQAIGYQIWSKIQLGFLATCDFSQNSFGGAAEDFLIRKTGKQERECTIHAVPVACRRFERMTIRSVSLAQLAPEAACALDRRSGFLNNRRSVKQAVITRAGLPNQPFGGEREGKKMASPSVPVGTSEVVVEQSPLRTTFVRSHSRFVLRWPDDSALVIKYHLGVRVVAWILCILGWPVLLVGLLGFIDQLMKPEAAGFVAAGLLLLWGVVVGLMGVWLLGPRYRFDASDGWLTVRHFWRTRRRPLAQIVAVQMIDAGWFGTTKESADSTAVKFQSYQLNLVLENPNEPRMFVAYNSDFTDMARKAKILADFLGVPLVAAPRVHEVVQSYSAQDEQTPRSVAGARRFRGSDAPRPVSDRRLAEPYRSWIDGKAPLPAHVRLLPRSVAVLYELGLYLPIALMCTAMGVLPVLMFWPLMVQGETVVILVVGGVCFLFGLLVWYLLRRLIHTIGAWVQLKRGTLRQGILVGPEGVLVRMEPNRCYAIALDRFVKAKVDVGLLRSNKWSRHRETPDFVIETLDGRVAFFLDWLNASPEQLNQWVAELRSAALAPASVPCSSSKSASPRYS